MSNVEYLYTEHQNLVSDEVTPKETNSVLTQAPPIQSKDTDPSSTVYLSEIATNVSNTSQQTKPAAEPVRIQPVLPEFVAESSSKPNKAAPNPDLVMNDVKALIDIPPSILYFIIIN